MYTRPHIRHRPRTARPAWQYHSPGRSHGTDWLCFALRKQRMVTSEASMSRVLHVVLLASAISGALSGCYSPPHHARATRTTLVARVYERCDLNGEHCVRVT